MIDGLRLDLPSGLPSAFWARLWRISSALACHLVAEVKQSAASLVKLVFQEAVWVSQLCCEGDVFSLQNSV